MSACSSDAPDIVEARYAISEPGPWHIPGETAAVGDTQYVENTQAGPWVGESGCGGGLLEGTGILREYIMMYWPQAYSIGGYSCRPIAGTNTMSVHATGRALDIMILTVDGDQADNSQGDVIGNWLIEHAEFVGIQMIIWDRWIWDASDSVPKDHDYTGVHPHHDHLHVELSVEAAALGTAFFQGPMDPPELISCGTIPADGGIIDDADNCAGFYGPAEFWRTADGVGHGGSLLWTNAYEGGDPSNWARWVLDVEQAGRYKAEVYLTPQYSVYDKVRYEVAHAGAVEVLEVDQGAIEAEGWYGLGAFDFAAGQGQHVSVFDNSAVPVPEEQHIAFDALRLTPCSGDDCDDVTPPGGGGGGGPEDGETADSGILGGCSTTGGTGSPAALLLLAGLFLRRRRRTRI